MEFFVISGIIVLVDVVLSILDKGWYFCFSIPITKKMSYDNLDFSQVNIYDDAYKTLDINDNTKLIRLKFNIFKVLGLWIPIFLPFSIIFLKSLIKKKEKSIIITNRINISPFIFLFIFIYSLTFKLDIIGYIFSILYILYMVFLIIYYIRKHKKLLRNIIHSTTNKTK